MTSVPDHSGKLLNQATADTSITHEPTRKREAARRTRHGNPGPYRNQSNPSRKTYNEL